MSETKEAVRPGMMRSVGGSALARMLVLPVSAILGILVTRLIIDNYGQASYAQYMLLVGIAGLIPFADLGISAAIVNAVAGADDPRRDSHLRGVLISCYRILAGSASTLTLIAVLLTVTGAWELLLGQGLIPGVGNLAAGGCLFIFAVTMLIGFGQRVLIALGLNALAIVIGGLQTPIVLLVLLAAVHFEVELGPFVALVSYGAMFVAQLVMFSLANRRLRPVIGQAFRAAWHLRTRRGEPVFSTAWPMLIQMVALPLAMQSDRIVLSQVSDVDELSRYALASQMFNPIFSVTMAASMALWPIFTRARASGEPARSPQSLSVIFGGVALLAVSAMSLAAGFLSDLASGGTIHLPVELLVAFSLLMVVQAAKSPLGMYMTDEAGLRHQALMVLLMLPVNVGLSILLAWRWGAVGPVVASVVSVALFQLLANWLYVSKVQRKAATTDRELS